MRMYETRVLPVSNASAAAAFNDAWVYRISTTLQRGTADIVHGVTQGEKVPMSAARMAKDQQVAEAALVTKTVVPSPEHRETLQPETHNPAGKAG